MQGLKSKSERLDYTVQLIAKRESRAPLCVRRSSQADVCTYEERILRGYCCLQGLKSLLERLDKAAPLMAARRRESIASPGFHRSSAAKRTSAIGDPRRASTVQSQDAAAATKSDTSGRAQAENARPSIASTAPLLNLLLDQSLYTVSQT